MKRVIYSLTAILFTLATFTACSSDDGPALPPTLDEVQTAIIGKWSSPEMELTFNPDNTMHIKHGELRVNINGGDFNVDERDDFRTYTISEYENLVGICFGDDEYMYIHNLANGTLRIELYGDDIFFTLAKASDESNDEEKEEETTQECYTCNGLGTITLYCSSCAGLGFEIVFGTCSDCDGKGETLAGNPCTNCNGSGSVHIGNRECRWCHGTGDPREFECSTCHGTGRIK